MRRPGWITSLRRPKVEGQARPGSWRDRLAVLLALVTVVGLCSVFFLSKGTQFLMPGPLTSAHGAIENCGTCHTQSGSGKLSWIHGLVAGDPLADSKACLTCHKMPDTAFNAHGASAEVLERSAERLRKIAALSPQPQSARAQNIAFPTHDVVARGVYCATCHQEHQGVNFNLNKISNEQCRSCHVVKFDSFDGQHPKFDNYPFERRTRIIYDHGGHFGKHYPEVAKKNPAKRIPATCSDCHNSRDDKRIMAVAPFEETCSACHLDKISGKERVSGPKGIAFLSLPGLDLQTLNKKNASIGEWPDASDAALTPFMKVMISGNERGRALIKTVDSVSLQDLSDASDDQITAVTSLVWEIKALFHALIVGKASDTLGDLTIGGGAKFSANLIADLTASIPRDVVISAQQQWLPNLATEIANGPGTSDRKQDGWNAVTTEPNSAGSSSPNSLSGTDERQAATKRGPRGDDRAAQPEAEDEKTDSANVKPDGGKSPGELSDKDARQSAPSNSPQDASKQTANQAKRDSPGCMVRLLGQCLISKEQNEAKAAKPVGAAGQTDTAKSKPESGNDKSAADKLPRAMRAGLNDARPAVGPEGAGVKTDAANAKPEGGKETPSADQQPQGKAADQSDDLLFPTAEELREIKAHTKGDGKAAQPEEAAGKTNAANAGPASAVSADGAAKADTVAPADAAADAAAKPRTQAQPATSVEGDVDPESWAEYGGWYRQDYGIFYRPTGHKDKFIYSWLFLTGPQAPKNDTSPAAAVFDFLTSKDAQGSCTKCHSVDDIPGKGRVVNFSQPSVEGKQGRFTRFIHEPHFAIMDNRGCLTCHAVEKDRPYLKSYEQGNPQSFVSSFGAVKKDLCQSCHTSSKARQDCLTCHKYHVNGVITPAMNTKNPTH